MDPLLLVVAEARYRAVDALLLLVVAEARFRAVDPLLLLGAEAR